MRKLLISSVIIFIILVLAAGYFVFFKKETDLIILNYPEPDQTVESPLLINGKARGYWYFEASFPVKIIDDNGFLLGARPAQTSGDWMTEDFALFSAVIPFAAPSTAKGKLILEKDNPSGLPERADERLIPIYFKDAPEVSKELMPVKIFLSDARFADEPYFDCSQTIALERQVPKTQAAARAAIEALLRGAAAEEKNQGYVSAINTGVRILGLTIKDGTANIDFDEQMEFQMGGSCRVAAVRAQVNETLKQFSAVNNVVISVNGRTADVLQP